MSSLVHHSPTVLPQSSTKTCATADPLKYLFRVALFVTSLAFLRLIPGEDALSTNLGPARLYETALVIIGLGLAPAYLVIRGRSLKIDLKHYWVVLGYCAWALASVAWSIAPSFTLNKALELAFIGVGTAVFSASFGQYRKTDHDLADAIVMVMITMVLITLLANAVLFGNPIEVLGAGGSRPRLAAAYSHSSVLGDFASYAILGLGVSKLDWRIKVASVPLLVYVKVMTDSRGANAAVIVALIAMFLLTRSFKTWLLTLYALGCGLIAYFYYVQQTTPLDLLGPIRPSLPHDLNTLDGRIPVWQFSMHYVALHPFTGIGYNASRVLLLPVFYWAGDTHNNWVEVLLTTGIVGLALLTIFVVGSFRTAIDTKDQLLFGMLIYQTIGSILGMPYFVPGVAMVLVVLCLNDARSRQRAAESDRVAALQAQSGPAALWAAE